MNVGKYRNGGMYCCLMNHIPAVSSDRGTMVYRRRGERCCVQRNDRFCGGSVMVFGGITVDGRTNLVFVDGKLTTQRYRNDILVTQVVPYVTACNLTFQQDNSRPNVARAYMNFLRQLSICGTTWTAKSWNEHNSHKTSKNFGMQNNRNGETFLLTLWTNLWHQCAVVPRQLWMRAVRSPDIEHVNS